MYIKGHNHQVGHHVGYLECDACDDRSPGDGVHCDECEFTVHEKCCFVFTILMTVKHPSHVGHRLKLLTKGAPAHTDPKCHICGKNTKRLLYHCYSCKLSLDIDCIVDGMCAQAHLNMSWHHHPLLMIPFYFSMLCKVCGMPDGYGYFCPWCRFMVHKECALVLDLPEINHSFHGKHSLKLLTEGAPDYTDPECHVCGEHTENFLYHCDICKFNLDMVCALEFHNQHTPIPVTLSNMKVHEHTLTLIPRLISFVCDACGMEGDLSPYVCLQCDLMFFHQDCAYLPRTIHINRHDHRVSYKYPLCLGEWKCEICLEEIDWSYGAYSCSTCSNYVLHSRCATRTDIWDGEELDGVHEEVEDIEPFKVNEDNTITHFSHEHNLNFNRDDIVVAESILCEGCVRPISSSTFYNCVNCSFFLHETCANLPKKKRHFLSPRPLTLLLKENNTESTCSACLQLCCKGFMYTDGNLSFDLMCCSLTLPLTHGSHPHPLLYYEVITTTEGGLGCPNCSYDVYQIALGCIKCNYFLDFRCATMPLTVRLHRYDHHPLILCYGEKNPSGKYWCDICERETNPEAWFYTCYDCGVTLHVFCVLGNVKYAKSGRKIDNDVELLFNNKSSRPLCSSCHYRCPTPFYFMKENNVFCSYYCLLRVQITSTLRHFVRYPPWLDLVKKPDLLSN